MQVLENELRRQNGSFLDSGGLAQMNLLFHFHFVIFLKTLYRFFRIFIKVVINTYSS